MEVSISINPNLSTPIILTQLRRSFVGTGWCSFARNGIIQTSLLTQLDRKDKL